MLISENYREQNAQLHADRPDYGAAGGQKWAPTVADIANNLNTRNILDYGAGKGSLARCLPAFNVKQYDPAIPEIAKPPEPCDVVACLDVLEHIEPQCLEAVLADLQRVTKQNLICVVCTVPAQKTLPDGRNAHLIVQDYKWWWDELSHYFEVVNFNNLGANIMFVLSKRVVQ